MVDAQSQSVDRLARTGGFVWVAPPLFLALQLHGRPEPRGGRLPAFHLFSQEESLWNHRLGARRESVRADHRIQAPRLARRSGEELGDRARRRRWTGAVPRRERVRLATP